MSKLTQERALEIIETNIQILYHLPAGYPTIDYYLNESKTTVKRTLLKVFGFLKKLYSGDGQNIIIDGHKYLFFLDNKRLSYGVRKSSGTATSNRHMNFLCAMGLFTKIRQTKQQEERLLQVNKNFFKAHPQRKTAINVYCFREYTDKELRRIEARSKRLFAAGITAGNINANKLWLSDVNLEDIAAEVFPNNNTSAPERKLMEVRDLLVCMEALIDAYGYATRAQIADNLLIEEKELDKLYPLFREQLSQLYDYKRPTKEQMQRFHLTDRKYIYTRKEKVGNGEETRS